MNGKDTLFMNFHRIEVKGLKTLETLTKQIDPYVTLAFDEGEWSNKTATIEGAGSNIHWDIDQNDDKWKLPFQSDHGAGSLSITLTDDNKLLTDEDIGKGKVLFSSLLSSSAKGTPGVVSIDLTDSIKISLTVSSETNPQVKHDHSKPVKEKLTEKTDTVEVNDDLTTPEGKSEGEPESRSPPKIEDKPKSTPRLEHDNNDLNTDIPLKPEESSPKLPPRRRHVTTKIKQPRKSDASETSNVSPIAAGHPPLPIDERPEWDNAPPGRSPPPLKRLSSVKVGIAKVNTNNYGAKSRKSLDVDSPHKPLEPADAPQSADKNPKTKRVQRNISKSSENNRELHLPPLPNNSDKRAPRRPRGNLAVTKDDSMVESSEEANRQISLPPMKESSHHESARKKKPLYLRLQEEYELKIAELEKEKKEMYEKELQKKRDARLNKDAIESHKAQYMEYKQQKREREMKEAEERKKAWKEMKDMLRAKRENPSRQNLMPPESAHASASAMADEATFEGAEPDNNTQEDGGGDAQTSKERKEKKQARPRASPSKAKLVPTPPPGSDPTSSKKSNHKEDPPSNSVKDQPTSKSPRKARNLTPHAPKEPKEISQSPNESLPSSQPSSVESPKNHSHNNGFTLHAGGLSVTVKTEEQSDNNDSVKVKSNWVSDMVETDPEEEKLAEVYEAGFSMLMAERGLIETK